jgi:hypothetical protein
MSSSSVVIRLQCPFHGHCEAYSLNNIVVEESDVQLNTGFVLFEEFGPKAKYGGMFYS